jgi:hypothetical protein
MSNEHSQECRGWSVGREQSKVNQREGWHEDRKTKGKGAGVGGKGGGGTLTGNRKKLRGPLPAYRVKQTQQTTVKEESYCLQIKTGPGSQSQYIE